MRYLSTRGNAPTQAFCDILLGGLAPDGGLYLPESYPQISRDELDFWRHLSYADLAFEILSKFIDDIPAIDLKSIVAKTYTDEVYCHSRNGGNPVQITPLTRLDDGLYIQELSNGPTLAFKDMAMQLLGNLFEYVLDKRGESINILGATSGDTGSAVANGFLGVEGIHVYVLYPKGLVSPIQECQFTTLGQNITALEVDGTFDDCQALVKSAFMDEELNAKMKLTSANSINVARFLPQAFYYFYAFAQLKAISEAAAKNMVVCVPSGNFGNITAGLFAKRMGLPVKRFIAANNRNDIFLEYLKTGEYKPRPSVSTIANAMDVGDPSNFARILDLYGNSHEAIAAEISGVSYSDEQIAETLKTCKKETGYLLDPHGACGYRALKEMLLPGEVGVFLETAHPAKFLETVEGILGEKVEIPEKLQEFMKGEKKSEAMTKHFADFKAYLLGRS